MSRLVCPIEIFCSVTLFIPKVSACITMLYMMILLCQQLSSSHFWVGFQKLETVG